MINLVEMDEKLTLSDQMEENISNVILINKLTVKPEDVDQLLRHCQISKCIVHFSNSLMDTDFKDDRFCERCNKILQEQYITYFRSIFLSLYKD